MRYTKKIQAFLILLLLITSITFAIDKPTGVNISLILDGNNKFNKALAKKIKKEIARLSSKEKVYNLPDTSVVFCDWSEESFLREYNRLSNMDEIDIIVSLGTFDVYLPKKVAELKKPTILLGALPDISYNQKNIPFYTQRKNLCPIFLNSYFTNEVIQLKKVYPFNELTLVVMEHLWDVYYSRNEVIKTLNKHQIKLNFITPAEALNKNFTTKGLNKAGKAVYFGYFGKNEVNKEELLRLWLDEGIKVFSDFSSLVEKGAVASYSPDTPVEKIVRRIALNIEQISEGKDPSSISPYLNYRDVLKINLNSLKKLNISPTFDVLNEAFIISGGLSNSENQVDFLSYVNDALRNNYLLKAEELNVPIQSLNYKLARDKYLPNLQAGLNYQYTDDDWAVGGQAEKTSIASLTLNQLIFSESASANKKIQQYLKEATDFSVAAFTNNIVYTASQTFIATLQSKLLFFIQKNNQALIKKTLDFAKSRELAGLSSKADVYRWESELSIAKSETTETAISYEKSLLDLKEFINYDIEKELIIANPENQIELISGKGSKKLDKVLNNPNSLKAFINFLVKETYQYRPEIKEIDALIKANKRSLQSIKRKRYFPQFNLNANYQNYLNRSGEGADVEIPADNQFSVTFSGILPFFENNSVSSEVKKLALEVQQLETQRKSLLSSYRKDVVSSVLDMVNNYSTAKNYKHAANMAEQSLNIIQDKYISGKTDLITLLDTQNASLSAKISSLNADYRFLSGIIKLQKECGFFPFLMSEEEQLDFFSRALKFVKEHTMEY